LKANLARFTRWAVLGAVPLLSFGLSLSLSFNDRGIRWDLL
jgi:hypothetical protein